MDPYYYSPSHYPLSSQSQSQFYPPFQHPSALFHPNANGEDDFIVDNPHLPPIHPQQPGDPDRSRDQETNTSATPQVSPGSGRICSLKGCGANLPDDYTFKMCESCRVKHQGYSRVKRSKRRQEKIDAGVILKTRGPNKPKPQLYRVNGQLSIDPKWEHLDRRLFPPRPVTPPTPPPPPAALTPVHKDGYRRKPLPPKDDGAIELNFIPVKICTIKGCYQPLPAEYEKKSCLECQERYKAYAVTKRAKRKALRTSGGSVLRGDSLHRDDMSTNDEDEAMSPPEEEGYAQDLMHLDEDIPIDPAIHEHDSSSSKATDRQPSAADSSNQTPGSPPKETTVTPSSVTPRNLQLGMTIPVHQSLTSESGAPTPIAASNSSVMSASNPSTPATVVSPSLDRPSESASQA